MPSSGPEPTPVVVLSDASTPVERQIVARWLTSGGLGTEHGRIEAQVQIPLNSDAVTTALVHRADDPLVVPVRVAWLPPERDGVRRTRLADLATLTNPRNPNRLMQKWIVDRAPDRHRVLTGNPALLSELRERQLAQHGSTDADSLGRYIVRSAIVTLERAERSLIGDRYKVPRMVAEEILDSPAFRTELDEIAGRLGIEPVEAHQRADSALRELVAVQSRLVTDLFTQAMSPFHKRAWTVHADETGLTELRALNRRHPLVFLPSHRSYVDPFVLGDVLARNDFPPNHLIGGANLNFWPMGTIARRTGAVFIRRSFGDDEIYKAVVEEYFAYLLSKRFNMEWYFEGGRTRTGKLRPPRYGLLNYLAEAVRSRRVDDVALVPVSITYERLNELGAIANEQLGGSKKPEGLAWMARYVRNQQHSAGHVYVSFGEPLSARDRLLAHGDVFATPRTHASIDEPRSRLAVQKLAFEIAVGINKVTPISASALVTLALLGVNERALTVHEVRSLIAPVLTYIEQRKIPQGELTVLRDHSGIAGVLQQLTLAKVVTTYAGGVQPVYSIEPGQHLVAAFYRNSAIHWFVNRALLELAILEAAEGGFADPLRARWSEAYRLRDLLKFEFFFPERDAFDAELHTEMLLIDPDWGTRTPSIDELLEKLANTGFMMAHRALRSFFDAQLVVAERLAARDHKLAVDRKQLLDECVAVGKQMQLQGRLHSPESVSSELFTTALKLADNHDLVQPGGDDLSLRREEFAHELRIVSRRVNRAELLDTTNLEGLADGPR